MSERKAEKNSYKRTETLLIALGGNALIRKGEIGTIEEQLRNLRLPILQIARLSSRYRIVITHGNGPQVGNLLLQQESCDKVPKLPLEILVAQTQGQMGYMIESALDSELEGLGHGKRHLVSLISYVVVDARDPAFDAPSKPIGPAYTGEETKGLPWPVRKTPKGYRRVVASPRPVTIVEKSEIRALIKMDFIVICCGGGGIPVIREGRAFCGVEAVIDKDLASARLAEEVGVDIFVIATDVPGVALNYGADNQRFIDRMTVAESFRYRKDGHFPDGSIWPKVEAAVQFIQGGGKRAVIASVDDIEEAVAARAGTELVM